MAVSDANTPAWTVRSTRSIRRESTSTTVDSREKGRVVILVGDVSLSSSLPRERRTETDRWYLRERISMENTDHTIWLRFFRLLLTTHFLDPLALDALFRFCGSSTITAKRNARAITANPILARYEYHPVCSIRSAISPDDSSLKSYVIYSVDSTTALGLKRCPGSGTEQSFLTISHTEHFRVKNEYRSMETPISANTPTPVLETTKVQLASDGSSSTAGRRLQ